MNIKKRKRLNRFSPTNIERMTKVLMVRMTKTEANIIERLSTDLGTDRSNAVRSIVKDYYYKKYGNEAG